MTEKKEYLCKTWYVTCIILGKFRPSSNSDLFLDGLPDWYLLDDNDKNLNLNLLFRMTAHPSWLHYSHNLILLHQTYSGPQYSQ